MQAKDVMTTDVVTADPEDPVRRVAEKMVERRVSGLPVVDAGGRLLGMVTDGDLFRRAELGTDRRNESLLDMLFRRHPNVEEFVESHARIAREAMTPDVVAVAPETSLRQVAELFEKRGFRRVPVVQDGRLVGIVSRADLVRALASGPASEDGTARLEDRHIKELVMAEFGRVSWGIRSEWNVIVKDGVVHLWGQVPSQADAEALRLAALGVPGVRGVEDHTVRYLWQFGAHERKPSTVTVVEPEREASLPEG